MNEENVTAFVDSLNNGFSYAGGYTGHDGAALLRCNTCGEIVTRSMSMLRKRKRIVCPKCAGMYDRVCVICGRIFTASQYRQVCCSEKCTDINRKAKHNIRRDTRLNRNNMVDKDITLVSLYKRDGGLCHLCGTSCRLDDYTTQGGAFIAGDWYPSIDHVKPLSCGGVHSWDNVKLAHRICNRKKSNILL